MYVYHRKPPNFQGNVLYPLNQLKDIFPVLYEKAASKYKGREMIMQQQIPRLNCLWNDVLHFSPVHPEKVMNALWSLGYPPHSSTWWKIDVEKVGFNATNTVVYTNHRKLPFGAPFPIEDFIPFEIALINEHQQLSVSTQTYYQECKAQNRRPLLFVNVAHVLHWGAIDIRGVEEVVVVEGKKE